MKARTPYQDAKEMGGFLHVDSDGAGNGAAFPLELSARIEQGVV
jgi:hypothetical protein